MSDTEVENIVCPTCKEGCFPIEVDILIEAFGKHTHCIKCLSKPDREKFDIIFQKKRKLLVENQK